MPFGAEVNQSSVLTAWRDFPRGVEYNSWPKKGYVGCIAYSQTSASSCCDQHLRMTEAIVIGMKGTTAAGKEKKEKFASSTKR